MERREIAFLGFGTATCLSWFPGLDEGELLELFLDRGPLFVEGGGEWDPLPLGQYKNFANSAPGHFLPGSGTDYNKDLLSGRAAQDLRMRHHRGVQIPLDLLGPFLEDCKGAAMEIIECSPPAAVRFDTRVSAIERQEDGYRLFSGETPVVEASKLVLATGAVERKDPRLEALVGDRLQLSTEILKGDLSRVQALEGSDPSQLVLVGSSHAAAAVLQYLGWEGANRPVTVVGRGVNFYHPKDHPYDGIRLMEGRFKDMLDARGEDRFVQVQRDFMEAPTRIGDGALVIQCLGLQTPMPTDRHTGLPFFDIEAGHPRVTSPFVLPRESHRLFRDKQPLPNAWGFGVGFAPVHPDGGREVGLDSFRRHAASIAEQLLELE